MAKQTKTAQQQATIARVKEEMNGLDAIGKLSYCANICCKYFVAQKEAQKAIDIVEENAKNAVSHASLLAFGMCIPMMGLYATTGIPAEVGYVFGAGMATCVGYGAFYCASKAYVKSRIANEMSTCELMKNTAVSVCDNSHDVQEFKTGVLTEFKESQQSKE